MAKKSRKFADFIIRKERSFGQKILTVKLIKLILKDKPKRIYLTAEKKTLDKLRKLY